VLKYGSVKAKFTANATYLQTLVVQAAQAVKADAQKAQQVSVAVIMHVAAKEAANAEAIVNQVEMTAEVAKVATVRADKVTVQVARVVVTVQVVREEDNINIK
jgi:5,10-methylenetetrahydrofolate reductase